MSYLSYDDLENVIENISRKYSRKSNIPYEDMKQELWTWVVEKKPEDIRWATRCLVNCAIDVCRKSYKDNVLRQVDYDDALGEIFVNTNRRSSEYNYNKAYDNNLVLQMIAKLPRRERIFAIVKGYLCEDLEVLESEYKEIYLNLPDDVKNVVKSSSRITDDLVLKYFLGIKTGVNSGSARTLKSNLKKYFEVFI